jgi:hypothetical protein
MLFFRQQPPLIYVATRKFPSKQCMGFTVTGLAILLKPFPELRGKETLLA